MIYAIKYPNGWGEIDTDRIAKKFLDDGILYVYTADQEERIRIIEFLEDNGFYCIEDNVHSRSKTVESVFPLIIKLREKSISYMGNVTVSAAAGGQCLLMRCRDFRLLYSLLIMSAGNDTDAGIESSAEDAVCNLLDREEGIDTCKISRMYLEEERLIVNGSDELVRFLKEEEFTVERRYGESVLPLNIDLKRNSISRASGTSVAWAEQRLGVIIRPEEFYLLYSVYKYQHNDG